MLAWTILSPLTYGHGYFAGAPRLFGRKSVGELRSRQRSAPFPHQPHDRHIRTRSATDSAIKKRANTDGQCGPNYGSCAAGYCCSPAYAHNIWRLAITLANILSGAGVVPLKTTVLLQIASLITVLGVILFKFHQV
jgi:hypothetical protein